MDKLYLGLNDDENEFNLTLKQAGNTIILGTCGTGKTNLIKTMIDDRFNIADENDDTQFFLVDMKTGLEYEKFTKLRRLAFPLADNPKKLMYLIEKLKYISSSREKLLKEYNYNSFDEINEYFSNNHKEIISRCVVFIDEIGCLLYSKSLLNDLKALMEKSKNTGITFVIGAQSYYPGLSKEFMNIADTKICLHTFSNDAYKFMNMQENIDLNSGESYIKNQFINKGELTKMHFPMYKTYLA